MKATFVALALCLLVSSVMSFNQPGCGRRPFKKDKVVGGKETAVGDHGWLVGFLYLNSFRCGGSVVNDRFIVTAAHCLPSTTAVTGIVFLVGAHNRINNEAWSVRVSPDRVIRHPNYNSLNFRNDIALYRLATRLTLTDYIVPICIPNGNDDFTNEISWAAGWGTMSSGGLATVKQEVDLKIVEAECVAYYGTSYDKATMICAGTVGDGKDTCQGDSGGPYIVEKNNNKAELVGITSWGRGCGDIGVCARTSTYFAWIRDWIQANDD